MDNLLSLGMALASDGHTAENLKQCYRNYDRIDLIQNILLMRGDKEKFLIPNQPKDNKKSEKFRLAGNKFYSQKKWFNALECYNKCICFATKGSEEMAIGYANRSAIYIELKRYKLCLENILLAKEQGIPDRLITKLNQREVDCKNSMESGNENPDIYQVGKEEPILSRQAHPQVPFIVDCLEMKTNELQGRHIITNDDLKPGEIVAIEDAFVCGLYENFNYRRCTYCTKENLLNLIPCDNCTNTMFCSECLSEPEENFHQFECPISYFLAAFEKTRFIFRMVVRAVKSFDSMIDMLGFLDESPEHTVFSFDHTKPLTSKQKFCQIYSLTTNEAKQTEMDGLFRMIYSTILYLNICRTDLNNQLSLEHNVVGQMVLAEIITHGFMIVPQNGHVLTSFDETGTEDIGGGIYPFGSLLNHSCSPNVFRVTSGTKNVFVVLRNIKKGEQLVDCYV